ncbi:unnamed protein product [Effrenium voratum]|nr:unnamed protein product [Effrenium voratum]CAJ1433095.1 unnamed protein product [Effrenium voratum]
MVLPGRSSPAVRRRCLLKRRLKRDGKPKLTQTQAAKEWPETMCRNIALEAVRVGNYYAEDQDEVLAYIAQVHAELLADSEWLRKTGKKLRRENGLTRRYTVQEILKKKHEADGFDVFVDPDEAILMAKRAAKETSGESLAPELTDADAAEIQEGLDLVVTAAGCSTVGVDEVMELLGRAVVGGEVGAAVYLAEHLEALHEGAPPRELAEKMFQALKPLLRPSASCHKPKLAGPWQKAPPGRFGALNPRKGLGRLLERLAALRKPKDEEAEAKQAEVHEAMQRLCQALQPAMAASAGCRRRAQFAEVITGECQKSGLAVSNSLAQALLQHMENENLLQVKGREVTLAMRRDEGKALSLKSLATDLPLLEAFAKKRLDRRRQRRQARETAKQRRKQKTDG